MSPSARQSADDAPGWSVAPDVIGLRSIISNVAFIGRPNAAPGEWVLVDGGVSMGKGRILRAVEKRFGPDNRPAAIILTHAHFDHVGALKPLAERWQVPVYAHENELPFLTGEDSYPPPDPTVGGGLISWLSPLFPRGPVDVSEHVRALPSNGTVPHLPDWQWVFTPGHSQGHISLFRESDRCLLAGDAFTTTWEESALAMLTQRKDIHRPPAYWTTDWIAAWDSVKRLNALQPESALTGHGPPMRGEELRMGLGLLAETFEDVAIPSRGRYLPELVKH